MRISVLHPVVVIAIGAILVSCAGHSHRQDLSHQARGGDGGQVTAESRHGHGVVSGPVRRGVHGRLEVRAPGGTWFECGRSCAETLRRETVDFWESRGGANALPDGPATLRWDW